MSENRNDEFEVTMSGKTQDIPKSSESLSKGFRKIEKLGNKAPMANVNIPNQITETVSTDKVKEQNGEPVQKVKTPVLNIKKQIQINQQDVRMVTEENNHSEKKIDTEDNIAEEATKKEKRNIKNGGSQKNKGKIIAGIVAVVVVIVAIILLWPCKHEWVDATCTMAKTCSKCDAVEGEPLGHSWNKATCTKPSECKRCKETEGKALGHKWVEKTEYDYSNNVIEKYSLCSTCGTKDNEKTTDLTTLLTSSKMGFQISPMGFSNRLNNIFNKMTIREELKSVWSDKLRFMDCPGLEIQDTSGDIVAFVLFAVNNGSEFSHIKSSKKNVEASFGEMVLVTLGYTKDVTPYAMQGFIQACDPKHDTDESRAMDVLLQSMDSIIQDEGLIYLTEADEIGFKVTTMPTKLFDKLYS